MGELVYCYVRIPKGSGRNPREGRGTRELAESGVQDETARLPLGGRTGSEEQRRKARSKGLRRSPSRDESGVRRKPTEDEVERGETKQDQGMIRSNTNSRE